MGVCVSSACEQKQGGRSAGKSGKPVRSAGEPEDLSRQCWVRSSQRWTKSRFDEGMDFIGEWRSVTVELDDSMDDIAPGIILSSITTVIPEPVFLLSDLIDMHTS